MFYRACAQQQAAKEQLFANGGRNREYPEGRSRAEHLVDRGERLPHRVVDAESVGQIYARGHQRKQGQAKDEPRRGAVAGDQSVAHHTAK